MVPGGTQRRGWVEEVLIDIILDHTNHESILATMPPWLINPSDNMRMFCHWLLLAWATWWCFLSIRKNSWRGKKTDVESSLLVIEILHWIIFTTINGQSSCYIDKTNDERFSFLTTSLGKNLSCPATFRLDALALVLLRAKSFKELFDQ